MNLESLRSLQMRIREATGPDREIDLEICKVFGIFKSVMKRLDAQGSLTADNLGAAPFTLDPDGLGPCVALIRSLFRIVRIEMDEDPSGCGARVVVWGKGLSEPATIDVKSVGYDMEQALIDCAVSVLIAQEEAKEKADA